MFDATLLDSSPKRVPVLDIQHWIGAVATGALGALASYLLLPLMFNPSPEGRLVESIILGFGVMLYELMLLYVLADARHLGLNGHRWSVALLIFNVVGFLAYLVYSARKTGDWKRAALPIAYILEGVVVCGLLLIPLIYTQALPDARWRMTSIPPPRLGMEGGRAPVKRVTHTLGPPDTHVMLIFPQPLKPHNSGTGRANAGENSSDPGFIGIPGLGDTVGVPFGSTIGDSVPPPPTRAEKPQAVRRLFLSTMVEQSKLIFGPRPVYPHIALITRTQGTV